jgi:prepilin signal peptidase PulO-like enzyme (type II secretory pathway)
MNAVFLSMALVFGACVGSFLNVVILRLPKQQALTGRSHCPSCGHQLLWWRLAVNVLPVRQKFLTDIL